MPLSAVAQTVFALIVVIGLLLVLTWLMKRFSLTRGLGTHALPKENRLEIEQSLAMGARQRLVVVSEGDKRLLIGVSPQGISLLAMLNKRSVSNDFANQAVCKDTDVMQDQWE